MLFELCEQSEEGNTERSEGLGTPSEARRRTPSTGRVWGPRAKRGGELRAQRGFGDPERSEEENTEHSEGLGTPSEARRRTPSAARPGVQDRRRRAPNTWSFLTNEGPSLSVCLFVCHSVDLRQMSFILSRTPTFPCSLTPKSDVTR